MKLIKLKDKFILVNDVVIEINDWVTNGKEIAQVNVLTIDGLKS